MSGPPQLLEVGELVTLHGRFTNDAGALTDPTAATIVVTAPDGSTVINKTTPDAAISHPSTGLFTTPLTVTLPGVYIYRWSGTGAIVAGETAYLLVHGVGQGAPRTGPCSDWATIDQLQACGAVTSSTNEGAQEFALAAASDLLWRWSGYKYGGICIDTVRPCAQNTHLGDAWRNVWNAFGAWPLLTSDCACQADVHRGCGCSYLSEVRLGRAPVVGIAAVKVDGATLSPTTYRVDDWQSLARIDGGAWPCCQDLTQADTKPNTWSVTYLWGRTPPISGVSACVDLATEIVKACSAGDCKVPENAQSIQRQGEMMVFLPDELAGKLKSNVRSVDRFLDAVGRSRPALFLNPDIDAPVRRTG